MRLDEKLKVIYETIAPTITRSEEAWKGYLRFGSAVYKHSFDNALLVYAQNPKATMLATFDVWKHPKVGRSINKDEKGIAVCEYSNTNLTIKHLFDVSQTNGKTVPAVWKSDDETKAGLLNRLNYSRGIKADTLADCVGQIARNAVADKADEYMRGFENDVKGHFLGGLPKDGLTAEIEELIGQSCKYFIACRCGIETDGIEMPTISHFDTIPLIARLGYAVTEISKGILLEIERSVKILESERSAKHEQRTYGQQGASRTHQQLGDRGRSGSAARQVRQDGDEAPARNRPPKVFTFEDAGRAYEPDVPGGQRSGGANREDNAEPVGERPAARNGGHFGENPALQPIQADGGGNRNQRDGADTEITEPEKEPQGSFSLGDYLMFDGKLHMLTYLDDKEYVIRSLDEKSTYSSGSAAQFKEYADNGVFKPTAPAELNKLFGFVADEIIWSDGSEYIIESFDTQNATLVNLIDSSIVRTLPVLEVCEILWTDNVPVKDAPPRLFSDPQIWHTPNKNIPYREGDVVRALFTSARVLQITDHAVRYIIPEEAEKGPYSMERGRFEENLENGVYRTITSGDTVLQIGPKDTPDTTEPPIITDLQPSEPSENGSFFMPSADDEQIVKEDLLKGSMTRGGKTRIYNFIQSNPKTADLAGFLKNEYGWSGHSGFGNGVKYVDYRSEGVQIDLRDDTAENGERSIKLSWNDVAKRITSLVESGEYLPEQAAEPEGSPFWQEYAALTERYPDSVVFKRLGDFYEVMGEKAGAVADELVLTLTRRDVGLSERVLMIGVPAHTIDDYKNRLIDMGYSVVVADAETVTEYNPAENELSDENEIDGYAIPDEPESYGKSADNTAEQLFGYTSGEQMQLTFDSFSGENSTKNEAPPAPDPEFQRLEQGYIRAKERLAELERKGAGEVEKYGEERLLSNPDWHKEHYEASEAVRSAKHWLDDYLSNMSDAVKAATPEPAARIRTPNDAPHRNYRTWGKLFPQIADGAYRYLRLESDGFMPLTIQRLGGNQYSIMHTFIQEGDMMRDPDMVIEVDPGEQTVNALSYEQSGVLYQDVYASGNLDARLQRELNSFFSDWLRNIGQQGFMPARAISRENDEDKEIIFDVPGWREIIEQKQEPLLRLTHDTLNAHNGQIDCQIEAFMGDDRVGVLYYSIFEDAPHISMIEVEENYRRQGIGTAMVQDLSERFPGTEIEWGMLTDDGAAFREAVTYTVENEKYTEAESRLAEINEQLARYDATYTAGISIPDDVADDWNDLEDEKYDLGNRLAELNPVKAFIRFDTEPENEIEADDYDEQETEDIPDISGGAVTLPDTPPPAQNYRYADGDELYPTGAKAKYQNNIAAIRLLKRLEAEKRPATSDEQRTLAGYVGWGGLSSAFNENNSTWSNEYQELKLLLTDEEYSRARSSTLTAYYTEQKLIECVYKGLANLGLDSGKGRKLLDPAMGTGNFYSVLPEALQDAKLYGVEIDSITGRIAKQLYPNANISVMGYESTDFDDNTFDAAIGNIPFNSIKVFDRRYEEENFYIHDYFIAKTIDKVKPGGVIAFITSKGTLDKYDSEAREYVARRADLLGAVRLPNNAFKALAGTEVTTDIIFLKKRAAPLAETDALPFWTEVKSRESDYMPLNRYFIDNPEMILGKMQWDRSMYGNEDGTACVAPEGQDLYAELELAMSRLKGIFEAEPDDEITQDGGQTAEHEDAPEGVKNFTYLVQDDKIYFVERKKLIPMDFTGMAEQRIKGLCGIKEALLEVIAVQSREYEPLELTQAQEKLNEVYDAFVKKYGFINSTANTRVYRDDDQLPLLCSIEKFNKQTETYEKEAIFTKATIKSYRRPSTADNVIDALMLSINYYQKVNIGYIAGLCGIEPDEVIGELDGKIYLNPLNYYGNPYEGWEIDEEYLSGNVKHKLEYATLKAQEHPELFTRNVDALKAVQPEPLTPSDISFRIGTKWIPLEYYQQFMHETFGTSDKYTVTLEYNKFTSSWWINGKMSEKGNTLVNQTFGTSRKNAYEIFEDSLNLQNVVIRDPVKEINEQGKEVIRYVTNPQQTAIAREKQEQIREKFATWLFKDKNRANILVGIYNDRYNVYRPRSYDGSYLNISGLNDEYKLMPHQLDFVARIAHSGSALNGHVVGGGKTLSLIASGMYMKDIGSVKKPVFVVPNNIIGQWANDFYRFFPAANILVTTEHDFSKKNRQKFISKIAMGEYDAVLITQSQFEKIPVSLERQMDMARAQIDEINWAIHEAKRKNGADWSIKDMERLAYNLELRIARLAANWKKDEIIDFEQLGIDFMFVDEAHNYKNGFIYTKIRNVAGVGKSSSQRAMDMLQKCQYLQETYNGRGVGFATGTPISNSLSELYIMQRYLQPDVLRELDSINFDDWVSNFAEVVTALEMTPEGSGYRLKSRFAKFFNLPELMNAFMLVADIKTADMLDLETPELEGGKAEVVVSDLSTFQKRIMSILSDRAMKVRNREVKPHVDNMLSITNDARIMSADARMLIPSAPVSLNSKISQCADKVFEIWRDTADKRLTQITFSDIGTPKKNQFNVYDELKRQCIERGIPADEIEFIHNANSDDDRQKFFDRMKSGELRLLLGSTGKLGTGANVQDKLYTVHHIDCPWRPSDIEQRDGRILRQGNNNPSVRIYRYITKGSFDSYLWQIQEQKLRFINQVITGRSITRDCEDLDETVLTAAQIKAMANGNPFVAEKMEVDNEVTTLRLLKSNWQSERVTYKNNIEVNYPNKIASYTKSIQLSNEDIEVWGRNKGGDFRIELEGIVYDERAKAAEAFAAIKNVRSANLKDPVRIGAYRGFELYLSKEWYSVVLELRGKLRYAKDLGDSNLGNITRIENIFDDIPKKRNHFEGQLEDTKKQLEVATAEIDKPFEHEERLSRLIARQNQLNMELEFKDLQNNPDKQKPQAAHIKDNFALLEAFAPELLLGNRNYMRFVSDGYSDLYLQRMGADILKIAYYYDTGNYRLRDPEVVLTLNMEEKTVTPVSYEQDTMLVRQNIYDKSGNLDEKLLSDLDSFIHDWLTDIAQQGYQLSPERQIENDVPFFDELDYDAEPDYEIESESENDGITV